MLFYNFESLSPFYGSYQDYRIVVKSQLPISQFMDGMLHHQPLDAYIRTDRRVTLTDMTPLEFVRCFEERLVLHILDYLRFAAFDYEQGWDEERTAMLIRNVSKANLGEVIRYSGGELKEDILAHFSSRELDEVRRLIEEAVNSLGRYEAPAKREMGSYWDGCGAPFMPKLYRPIFEEMRDTYGRKWTIAGFISEGYSKTECDKRRAARGDKPVRMLTDPLFRFTKYEQGHLYPHVVRRYVLDAYGILPAVLTVYDSMYVEELRDVSLEKLKSISEELYGLFGNITSDLAFRYFQMETNERERIGRLEGRTARKEALRDPWQSAPEGMVFGVYQPGVLVV